MELQNGRFIPEGRIQTNIFCLHPSLSDVSPESRSGHHSISWEPALTPSVGAPELPTAQAQHQQTG